MIEITIGRKDKRRELQKEGREDREKKMINKRRKGAENKQR